LCRKLLVLQTLSGNQGKYVKETIRVRGFPLVESERLFIKIAEQMERLDAYVTTFDGSLSRLQKFSIPLV